MTAADRLDEIRTRADAATDGPWEYPENLLGLKNTTVFVADRSDGVALVKSPATAEFIAHARTDVPALVAALRAVLNACSTYEKTQAIYRIEMGQREIIRVVRAEVEAALGEVAS